MSKLLIISIFVLSSFISKAQSYERLQHFLMGECMVTASSLLNVKANLEQLVNEPKLTLIGEGIASYYGKGFHGRKTASGEVFNQNSFTCAHKTLPFGTKLLITRIETGDTIVVTVNDRGPYIKGRVLDLSYMAAKELDMLGTGKANVKIEKFEN